MNGTWKLNSLSDIWIDLVLGSATLSVFTISTAPSGTGTISSALATFRKRPKMDKMKAVKIIFFIVISFYSKYL